MQAGSSSSADAAGGDDEDPGLLPGVSINSLLPSFANLSKLGWDTPPVPKLPCKYKSKRLADALLAAGLVP